ncbi:C40 family peptidase [Oceanihabitans sp.]|nr:C40 family peptidase [Oceanihabitans sp.]
MKKITLILIILCALTACNSSKNKRVVTKKTGTSKSVNKTASPKTSSNESVNNAVDYAKSFKGVRYKYGGTTKKGIDCSGLVYTAFKKENINVPRTTKDLSKTGKWIDVNDVQEGDLLFFATKKNSRSVNHVGIVTTSRTGYVEFIHASTSKGVMISNLAERYWYLSYVQARRIL